jgi:hypothetical protein
MQVGTGRRPSARLRFLHIIVYTIIIVNPQANGWSARVSKRFNKGDAWTFPSAPNADLHLFSVTSQSSSSSSFVRLGLRPSARMEERSNGEGNRREICPYQPPQKKAEDDDDEKDSEMTLCLPVVYR